MCVNRGRKAVARPVAKAFLSLAAFGVLVLIILRGDVARVKQQHSAADGDQSLPDRRHLSDLHLPVSPLGTQYADVTSRDEAFSPPTSKLLLNRTYVVVLKFDGQQGSGMRSLSVLQCVLGSFYRHFYIVEPFVGESSVGTHNGENGIGVNFSVLFDLDSFNAESRRMGYPEMVTFVDYMRDSPKYVIYVKVRESFSAERVIWSAKRDGGTVECFDKKVGNIPEQFGNFIEKTQQRFAPIKPQHCIVRVIELHVTKINDKHAPIKISPTRSIYDLVFDDWSPTEVSLVFTYYYNKLYVPVDKPLHGIDCLNSYSQYEPKAQFKPSTRLIRDAKVYEGKFFGGRNKLAIMLRVERILKYYVKETGDNRPKNLKECFQEVTKMTKAFHNGTDDFKPMVTLDIGTFGTHSFHTIDDSTIQLSRRTLRTLYDDKWTLREWEESFAQVTGGETSGPYIAALQRILASRADCLILMGGGSFQAMAIQDYMVYHQNSEKCIHLVCVMTERNIEVQKTIKKFQLMPH